MSGAAMPRAAFERVVVTGGAGGIGRGVVAVLAQAGAHVVSADLVRAPDGDSVIVDVTDERSVEDLRTEATRLLGAAPDLLVTCAGVLTTGHVVDLDPAEWDRVMAVNVRGTFLCARAFAPAMIRRGAGNIVTIASVSGRRGEAGIAHYCASKFAVIGFTQALACELAPHGIRVNAVCPGTVDTAMMRTLAGSAEGVMRYAREQLIPRPVTPREVGEAVAFLAASTATTGQALNVDGGWAFS